MDASSDGTAEVIEDGRESRHEIVLVPQSHSRRIGGLGGAVVQGLRVARAPWVCVMDADLQHPPELITALLEQAEARDLDLVVASRYCARASGTASAGRAPWPRARPRRRHGCCSRAGSEGHRPDERLLPGAAGRDRVDGLRPRGFKILLEILVRHPGLRVAEVSFAFGERHAGRSKATFARACATSRCSRGCASRASAPSGRPGSSSTRSCSRS